MGFSRNRVGRESAFFTAWARRALGLPAGTVVLAREVPCVEAPNAIFTGLTSLLRLANTLPPSRRHAVGMGNTSAPGLRLLSLAMARILSSI